MEDAFPQRTCKLDLQIFHVEICQFQFHADWNENVRVHNHKQRSPLWLFFDAITVKSAERSRQVWYIVGRAHLDGQ